MIPATHEPRSRPTFRERVHALAGHGTFREPAQGSSEQRQIPADHLIAAALSFGRRNPRDIGPDMAIDMATGRPGHYLKCCEWAGRAVAADRGAPARRAKPWAAHVAVSAYNALVRGYSVPPAPEGCREDDWAELVLFACLLLEYAAEDALALAGRRHRRVA
ncbi:MAG TPA: hypothetical protein VGV14_04390 [Rhodanobacter sp.]|nr:hypothetical protein [Rhodanobacter sp.]